MKYTYSRHGYHPRDVSFEVEAIYLENEADTKRGYAAVQNTVLGALNYSPGGYARQMALGFDPVTDNEATTKYVTHKHKVAVAAMHAKLKKQQKKQERKKYSLLSFLRRTKQRLFKEVIDNMINRHIFATYILDRRSEKGKKAIYPDLLDVAEVAYVIEHKKPSVKYKLSSEIDSPLQEEVEQAVEKQGLFFFVRKVIRQFFSVIRQNMTRQNVIAASTPKEDNTKEYKQAIPRSVNIHHVSHFLKHQHPTVKYSIHPHVDSLLRERYAGKELHL